MSKKDEPKIIQQNNLKRKEEVDAYNKQLNADFNAKYKIWSEDQQHIMQRMGECKSVLDLLYSDSVLYEDYKNIIAVVYIRKYFESGRAKSLPEAYNIFSIEFRLDKIGIKLDEIRDKLDLIIKQLEDIDVSIRNFRTESRVYCDKFMDNMNQQFSTISENQNIQIQNQKLIENDTKVIAENTDVLKYFTNSMGRKVDLEPFARWYHSNVN